MTLAFAAMLSAIVLVQACSEEAEMPASIYGVKTKYEDQLMAKPGVVSVGIGRDDQGNAAIIVGLDRPRAETVEALPKELEGYPVLTSVTGPLKAQ